MDCPACKSKIILTTEYVRTSAERIEDDTIYFDRIMVAKSLRCGVCGLTLEDTGEIASARLPQQFVETSEQSLDDRFADSVEWDYGND